MATPHVSIRNYRRTIYCRWNPETSMPSLSQEDTFQELGDKKYVVFCRRTEKIVFFKMLRLVLLWNRE
jgi:hypothetical protein